MSPTTYRKNRWQARLVGSDRYLFVNTQRANPSIKTVSRFFEYKTWTEQIWRTE
ncbi:DUF4751 family protein, partial [Salmonella enterica subsp. enterica serovar Kentucky]|nr:DUF4751 family protein [Salmonella enterica subsp. enterica serovar Kentucky]